VKISNSLSMNIRRLNKVNKKVIVAKIAAFSLAGIGLFCTVDELKKNYEIVGKCQKELKELRISQPEYDQIVKKNKSVWTTSETVAVWEEALSNRKIQVLRDSIKQASLRVRK